MIVFESSNDLVDLLICGDGEKKSVSNFRFSFPQVRQREASANKVRFSIGGKFKFMLSSTGKNHF